ncbi:SDR family oxidoreductase [Alteromonas sp. BMJM2]|uniref:SDR family oxidoreductase n=1 Tax=Alteromonas sp. BMJM2 TaxID=2954241 RepID=UPI0022B4AAB2|nr:SDR family oxidoreductase [Alteromonas sp. BMJM2]
MRIIITGGATGLGKALAIKWAEKHKGIKICIADINQARGNETVEALTSIGADAFYVTCDITSETNVNELASTISAKWQGIDYVFNNAGVATGGSLLDETPEQWQWVFDINMLGMVRVSRALLPLMQTQGHGYFVNIASQAGITPIPYMGSYNAMKAAVVAFSETMKLELAPDNVGVSVVCPSFFKTNLDESMRSANPASHKMLNKLFAKADMSKEDVAQSIYQQVNAKQFLILTHKEGKRAFLLKKLLSSTRYLKMMLSQTKTMKQVMDKRDS